MAHPFASLFLFLILLSSHHGSAEAAVWCVARVDATSQVLQSALDYACAAGADCAPIQPTGLCYLPNTVQAHASYAINSYFQRRAMAPGSCYFVGTATVAKTDPSYGSCVYPNSLSAAGGTPTTRAFGGTPATTITGDNPTTTTTSPSGNTGPNPPSTTTTTDESSSEASPRICTRTTSVSLGSLLIMVFILFLGYTEY